MLTIPITPSVEFDAALVRRLSQAGPRYTSYPSADRFQSAFGEADYRSGVATRRADAGAGQVRGLSLYVHIPFCQSLCYYCGCNKIITQDRSKAVQYLDYLDREIALQGALFAGMNRVGQLHFGGGTPTYLDDAQMDGLLGSLRSRFEFASDEEGEFSVEIDPRTVTPERMHLLRRQGFNRVSLGIQDFDPAVQRAVNRIQPYEQTAGVLQAARAAGFRSVSVDLIYGLPCQSPNSMAVTLEQVIGLKPDRLALYNYAHLPHLFKSQSLIDAAALPDPETKLAMLALCIERLTAAGYVYIGMDHFALPGDDLARSQREGRLHRNFQGYSTHAESDMVALGVSAISQVGGCYSQNEKTLPAYYAALDEGRLPVARGVTLDADDCLRRSVIGKLMCDFELDFAAIDLTGVDAPGGAAAYFAAELERLKPLEEQGLLCLGSKGLKVKLRGRLLIRNICMVFDRYLHEQAETGPPPRRYSATI
jgi:oxygen-independent coproporphyrinogen-3 oxidase